MNIIKTTCAAVLILAAAASQAAPDPAKLSGNPTGEALAHTCAACHGTYGELKGEHFVPLAGMDEGEFITSMKDVPLPQAPVLDHEPHRRRVQR